LGIILPVRRGWAPASTARSFDAGSQWALPFVFYTFACALAAKISLLTVKIIQPAFCAAMELPTIAVSASP
jgi:hypothetical protein